MKATQGRMLIVALRRCPHTYLEMLGYGISTAPWKRVAESLRPDEKIEKGKHRGLVTWRVVKRLQTNT